MSSFDEFFAYHPFKFLISKFLIPIVNGAPETESRFGWTGLHHKR